MSANLISTLKSHLRAATAATALLLATGAQAADLNALIWCDHSDPALLQPFEQANNVKVNVKEFEGTGAGLAIVEQSQPGDWDAIRHVPCTVTKAGDPQPLGGGRWQVRVSQAWRAPGRIEEAQG